MRTGHLTTDTSLIKTGHRLLSSLFASYDYALLRRDDDPDPMDEFQQFEDEEISEWLLTLAAIARVTDDELGTLKNVEKNFPDGVGILEEGGKEAPLNIREACKVENPGKIRGENPGTQY